MLKTASMADYDGIFGLAIVVWGSLGVFLGFFVRLVRAERRQHVTNR